MNFRKLIVRNLWHFRKGNILLALGISVSTAVITGALMVGDSVNYSLNRIASDRLGATTHTVSSGERYLTSHLAKNLNLSIDGDIAAVLTLHGSASAGGGEKRISQVNIIGIDKNFNKIAQTDGFYDNVRDDRVIINSSMAERLGVKTGDQLLLRITRASLIPMNAPFVSDVDNIITLRAEIDAVAGREDLGLFNLKNTQKAPFNVFISNKRLNEIMDLKDKVNLLLIHSDKELNSARLISEVGSNWTFEDAGLSVTKTGFNNELQVTSERVFIDNETSKVMKNTLGLSYPVFTYFVNSFSTREASTPYSFVSSLPDDLIGKDEIIINSWLADDLDVKKGDSLLVRYFIIGPLRNLAEQERNFLIRGIEPIEGRFADRDLMPQIPGLSDAGNCRDWETGIPIDLEKIRDKDEKYWEDLKGTPKAFISLSTARELWGNRFGSNTAFRFNTQNTTASEIKESVLSALSPGDIGIKADNVRQEAVYAAENGVDFSQLFAGLSFFLLIAGIALSILLLILNLEFRKDQLKLLTFLGIPFKKIFNLVLGEGFLVALTGSLVGLVLAVFYNKVIFTALNSVWKDIIRTDMMELHVSPDTLLKGFLISVAIALISMIFPLRKFLKNIPSGNSGTAAVHGPAKRHNLFRYVAFFSMVIAFLILSIQLIRNEPENAGIFFISGGLILLSGILFSRNLLYKYTSRKSESISPVQMSLLNASRNPSRSLTIIVLFALATFLVISTGSNRKGLFIDSDDPKGGTGGFLFYAESTVPVLHDLNRKEKRYEYGLGEDYSFVQFRKSDGDDASCLNLNRIRQPGIIATDPEQLKGRFQFVSKTDEKQDKDPWLTLNKELPENIVPAIADQTVIKWGLGMKTGDTLKYRNSKGESMNLLLVGGLAPSIFQGNVIISEKHFLENFPQNSGTSVFLINGNKADSSSIKSEIQRGLRDYGISITPTAKRLAEFNSVTNTYLSIFLVLGALGILLGTIGLGIVLFKSVLERKNEIAVMRALGHSVKVIKRIVNYEYLLLFAIGTGLGFFAAIISTLPSFIIKKSEVSIVTFSVLLLILLLNGWLWTAFITRLALKNKSIYASLRNE